MNIDIATLVMYATLVTYDGWLVGWLVGWLDGWLVGWMVSWLVGCLVGCLVGWGNGEAIIILSLNSYVSH